jgi:chromatin remodeling complex protein RSC6
MIKPQDKRKAEKIPALLNPDAVEQLKRHAEQLDSDIDYVAGAIIEQYLSRIKSTSNADAKKKRGRKPKAQAQEWPSESKNGTELKPVDSAEAVA